MKKIHFWGLVLVVGIIVVAVFSAMEMGEKSPVLAAGTVTLSETLKEKAATGRSLFIVIYDAESPMPMPYGAYRTSLGENKAFNSYSFILTPENTSIMAQGRPLPKKIRLKARLDVDGQGGMDTPGDMTGEVSDVETGRKDIAIVINNLVQ